jgi:3-deoxy-manno-octulosonate cytidylyltransferase (CMP-KDO synthetase)
LEQLRFLANDIAIYVADACAPVPSGIDTEQDLENLINALKILY